MGRRAGYLLLAALIGMIAAGTTSVSGAFTGSDEELGALIAVLAGPPEPDEVMLVVTIGPDVRGRKGITVARGVPRDAYDYAHASARDPRKRSREANVLLFRTLKPDVFADRGGVPLRIAGQPRSLAMTYLPGEGGKVETSALAKIPMPRYARRALKSLIDTSTGEVVWADE